MDFSAATSVGARSRAKSVKAISLSFTRLHVSVIVPFNTNTPLVEAHTLSACTTRLAGVSEKYSRSFRMACMRDDAFCKTRSSLRGSHCHNTWREEMKRLLTAAALAVLAASPAFAATHTHKR